jgi:hypothetical protein
MEPPVSDVATGQLEASPELGTRMNLNQKARRGSDGRPPVQRPQSADERGSIATTS